MKYSKKRNISLKSDQNVEMICEILHGKHAQHNLEEMHTKCLLKSQ
jgi:hypothetical protein